MNGGTASPTIEPGRKPNRIVPVPLEYQVVTLIRERDVLVNDILVQTSCVVVPRWDHGKITRFELYGIGTEQATVMINKWILKAHVSSKATSAWPRTSAFNPDEWYYQTIAELETDRKKMFKGPVPKRAEDAPKLPSAIVDWPEDLRNHPVTPRDAFGNKLEALNDLRTRDEVFITLLPNTKGLWQVEITGFVPENVQVGEQHYRTMIDKVRAETTGLQIGLNIALDAAEGIAVCLEEAEEWWPNRADRIVPRLVSSFTMCFSETILQERLVESQLVLIQSQIKQALEAIQSKKGSYDFAIRLGCLALVANKTSNAQVGQRIDKVNFLKGINSTLEVMVKKWAFDNELGSKVMKKLITTEGLLEPIKSGGLFGNLPPTLEQTVPVFRGTWVFRDPNVSISQPAAAPLRHAGRPALAQHQVPHPVAPAPATSLFVVQVDWTDDEKGLYEKTDMRFYRLAPGKTGPNVNMDINLLGLAESKGWTFALESLLPVSRQLVSPALLGFAKSVSMKPKHKIDSKDGFARWDATPTIQRYLTNHRLDKLYSYGLQGTCYKLELTAMWYPRQQKPVWGLAVRHVQWATHLAELERLPIGEKASWGDIVETFLPADGQMSVSTMVDVGGKGKKPEAERDDEAASTSHIGIKLLSEKLLQISALVASVAADGGVGGVALHS